MNQPCAEYRRERSQNGKKLPELKSGLQKYIRRGQVDKALWCAGELLSFRQTPEGAGRQRIGTNFRHRLQIITLEDVGDVGLWTHADTLNTRFNEEEAVHEWVWLLASATKARICSHARAVATIRGAGDPVLALARSRYPSIAELYRSFSDDSRRQNEPEWRKALADALRVRSPLACFWAWLIQSEGAPRTINRNRKPVWQIFEALEAAASSELQQVLPIAKRWYKRDLQNLKEGFLCWMLPLLAHIGGHPFDQNDELRYVPPAPDDYPFAANRNDMEMDSFVYDIHTDGPKKGGLVTFALEGSFVENESMIVNVTWRHYYEDRKRVADGVAPVGRELPKLRSTPSQDFEDIEDILAEILDEMLPPSRDEHKEAGAPPRGDCRAVRLTSETDYEFLVRAQINTSRGKTDVYFARDPTAAADHKLVVVKGPFESRDGVDYACAMADWKRARGLPAAMMRPVCLLPDRWPEGVPLGLRNQLPRDEPAWFLVADSLLPSPPPLRRHGPTKLWPVTEVADWSQLTNHLWAPLKGWATYTCQEKTDYVLALLARYVVGIGDLADRNFIRAAGRVYSVDEDTRAGPAIRPYADLRKNKAALVRQWLEERWEEIGPAVANWEGGGPTRIQKGAELARWAIVRKLDTALGLFGP